MYKVMKNRPVKHEEIFLHKPGDLVFILGKELAFPEGKPTKQEVLELNRDIRTATGLLGCFTYRSTWSKPLAGTSLFSDAGWGCMIRAGQMALFNLLAKELLAEGPEFLEDGLNYLLISFHDELDEEVAPFSIRNIVKLAQEKFSIKVGQWFRATSIVMALEMLSDLYKPQQAAKVAMFTMVDSTIFLSKLHAKLFDLSAEAVKALPVDQMLQELYSKPWNKSLMLNIASMIGASAPDPCFAAFLEHLMKLETFCGVLGGAGNRAFYIFGLVRSGLAKSPSKFLYFDPHLIQPVPPVENHQIWSYFNAPIYSMVYRELNTSLAICFHLRDGEELRALVDCIKSWKGGPSDESFISVFDSEISLEPSDIIMLEDDLHF